MGDQLEWLLLDSFLLGIRLVNKSHGCTRAVEAAKTALILANLAAIADGNESSLDELDGVAKELSDEARQRERMVACLVAKALSHVDDLPNSEDGAPFRS